MVGLLFGAALAGCVAAAEAVEPGGADPAYKIVHEEQTWASLRLDWKGAGRDLGTGKSIEVPETDVRRKSYVAVEFWSRAPILWRSNLERRLKSGELRRENVLTEPAGSGLMRATIENEPFAGEFFFKSSAGPDLDRSQYVAVCSMPLAIEKGAIQCSTQLDVDSFVVQIKFDRAFLWDFERLQARAVGAARHYIVSQGKQRSIESEPQLRKPGNRYNPRP